ncbi:hypothetical protein CFR73_12910 [Novacetimonas maltaceti]|uniref:Uncharacterized protein n=1 Tax=Novacetimonas maltaceti TaxID=1203393 RepID=A0A2S3W0W6_9PROT|nr:hypothetical protein [Novacetimonas maltaceti]POF62193.1 hypothetical protein KMAL_22070 [Novacetimonas maltaceti]PYD59224.1 hypothetical protein CFR73_12910 [Novacetimonas maltaceti]BCZ75935.1 hypothetical protein [Komagataeibacter phage phiKM1]
MAESVLFRGLSFGREVYDVEIHGMGNGQFIGLVKEDGGPCRIAFRGSTVVRDGRKVALARGSSAWVESRKMDEGSKGND